MNISVIIPVYNAQEFLPKAVESALQFDEVKEILLIEDASTDQSLEVCKNLVNKYQDHVKLYQHPDFGNHGAGATRNLGLEKVSQEYIAFLDADDYYLPNRFDAERILFQNPKVDGVFGAIGVEFLSEKGKSEYKEKFKDSTLTTVKFQAEGIDVFQGLLGLNGDFGVFFSLIALTVKKASIEKYKLRFNANLRVHQDTDFITKLAFYSHLKTGIIDQAVSIRGVHDDNRITKIKQYSSLFYRNLFLLYQSLDSWSKTQKNMSTEARKHIHRSFLSFESANKNGVEKYTYFCSQAIADPTLLKTRYRFHALNKPNDL